MTEKSKWRFLCNSLLCALLAIPAWAAGAQAPAPASRPHFEAVSIRVDPADESNGSLHGASLADPITWRAMNISLFGLITIAYGLRFNDINRIVGVPKSMWEVQFQIQARLPPHAYAADLPLMLQAMLADRFKLVVHTEKRLMRAAALTLAPGGPKIMRDKACENPGRPIEVLLPPTRGPRPAGKAGTDAPGCGMFAIGLSTSGKVVRRFRGVSMAQFAEDLTSPGLPVVDQTGLEGAYDFSFGYEITSTRGMPRDQGADIDAQNLHNELAAFVTQLGLKISLGHPTRQSVTVYVVDHVEKPTPN